MKNDKIKEWFQSNKYKIQTLLSYLVLIFIFIILSIPFAIDLSKYDLSKILLLRPFIIDNNKVDNIMNTLFSVQASVSTLGIALISILGGICKDTVFGISVTRYITQMKPAVFTHKRLVVSELVLIIFGYIALSTGLYNFLIAIFSVSIGMTIKMVYDIFFIFKGNSKIEKDVSDYYKKLFSATNTKNAIQEKQSVIYDISQHIRIAVNENKYIDFEKDLEFFQQLFVNHIHSDNVSNDEKKDKILQEFQNKIIEFSKEVFNKAEYNFTLKTVDFLEEIHRHCNDLNKENCNEDNIYDKYIYLNIFNFIYIDLINCVDKISRDLYFDIFDKIIDLRFELFDNMYFTKYEELQNNHCLNDFSRFIYKIFRKTDDIYTNVVSYSILGMIFSSMKNSITDDFNVRKIQAEEYGLRVKSYEFFHNLKQDEVIKSMYILAEKLIISLEVEQLTKQIFNELNEKQPSQIIQFNFDIIVFLYCYYINKNIEKYKNLFVDNQDIIKNFLYNNVIIKKSISFDKCLNNVWELESSLNNPSIKYEFLVFYIMYNANNKQTLVDYIESICKNRFIIFNCKDKDNINKYQRFVKLFFDEEVTEEQAEEKIKMFEKALKR